MFQLKMRSSAKLVSTVTGFPVQPNQPILGANVFAHESGIHQDGILKHREKYGEERFRLVSLRVRSETGAMPESKVVLTVDDEERSAVAVGGGPVDATYSAIEKIVTRGLCCAFIRSATLLRGSMRRAK